ncbi:MAG: aminotransferase class III-fold pyridoxal phosphate-dependent enzyme [Acidimicrobiia bacterium]|nr:aminotransferase class III-fold pyridoxal phosphate-dependent enzyme [Acidimicrobiia bacterium]
MPDLTDRHASVVGPVIDFDTTIEIVASEGSWVTAADGRKYLDFSTGISVSNLGHQPPTVKRAILDQLDKVWHSGMVFRYESMVSAAERLQRVTPDGIDKFIFINSGTEAVEASVKLARKVTGRQGVIVFRGGFHGRTMGSVSYTTSKAKYRQGYHPLLGSVFVTPFPRPFRWKMTQEEATGRAVEELHLLLKHEIDPSEVAAFLIEPVQGEGGYYPAGVDFLTELRRLGDEHGVLLVADEVQTGFGRTGDWFATSGYRVRPDVLAMGKAIANGLPLSAVGARGDLMDSWPPGAHGTTFGGNPVCCAACVATIDTLADVVPQVDKLSTHAFDRFGEMQQDLAVIGDVRGLGLMIGVDLVQDDGHTPDPGAYEHLKAHCLEEGMLLLNCGPDGNVIRFIPPLNVSTEDLDRGIDIIDSGLRSYRG